MATRIEFFYDIGSPYSYLAAFQAADLARDTGVPVQWRPFLLGGVFRAVGNTPPATLPSRGNYMLKDLQRCAAQAGAPFNFPRNFPLNTLTTMRALAGLQAAELPAASLKLYRAYWYDGIDVSAPDVLADLLGAAAAARANDEAVKQKLKDSSDEAVRRGAFGAPTFFVGDEMFFGADRIPLLKWWLAQRKR